MRTIAECARMLREDDPGTAITQNAIRTMALTGAVPVVRVGIKRLIDYDHLLEAMRTPPEQSGAPAEYGAIRRIGA